MGCQTVISKPQNPVEKAPPIYRLGFHPTIKSGEWYFGFACAACGEQIHALEDKSNGTNSPIILGSFSVPCYHCGHEGIYESTKIKSIAAVTDRPALKGKRPPPSKSQKKPYLPHFRNYKVTMGPPAIEVLPEISLVIARIVSYWTMVETQLSSFLSICLKANSEPSVALYLSLKNSRAKSEALEAVVTLTLDEDDQKLFSAAMRWKDAVEKTRNEIAHGVLGSSFSTKDHVFWMSTGDYATHAVKNRREGMTPEIKSDFDSKLYVFEIGVLERIAREIEELYHFLGAFGGYLTNDDPAWRKTRYPQLCSEPKVSEELRKIRK